MYENLIKSNPLFKKSRLRSLYSNFDNLKEANPDGYEANVLAWKQLLNQIIDSQSSVVLDTSNLVEKLSVSMDLSDNNDTSVILRPLSIDTVLNEIINDSSDKKLIPIKQFDEHPTSIYAYSIFSNISVKGTLLWALSKSGLYDPHVSLTKNKNKSGNYLVSTKLVSISQLEKLRKPVIEFIKNFAKEVYEEQSDIRAFTKSFLYLAISKQFKLSDLDYELMLRYLSRDTHDVLIQSDTVATQNGETLDIKDPIIKIKTSALAKDEQVTTTDVAVAQLKASISSTNTKISSLSAKVDDYTNKIQTLIKQKSSNRDYIKLLLRMKKSIENSLIQSSSNLSNLESLLSNIVLQNENIKVFQLLGNSKTILKNLNNELNIEKVDTLLDNVSEEYSKVNEVNDRLSQFNSENNNTIDENEIDNELAELEKEETAKLAVLPAASIQASALSELESSVEPDSEEQNLIERLKKLQVSGKVKKDAAVNQQDNKKEKEEGKEALLG